MIENLWQVFRETGDPLCYLLYRAGCADRRTDPSDNKPDPA